MGSISASIRHLYGITRASEEYFFDTHPDTKNIDLTINTIRSWDEVPQWYDDAFCQTFDCDLGLLHQLVTYPLGDNTITMKMVAHDVSILLLDETSGCHSVDQALEYLYDRISAMVRSTPSVHDADHLAEAFLPSDRADGIVPSSGGQEHNEVLMSTKVQVELSLNDVLDILNTDDYNPLRALALCVNEYHALPEGSCTVDGDSLPIFLVMLAALTHDQDDINRGCVDLLIPDMNDATEQPVSLHISSDFHVNEDGSIHFDHAIIPTFITYPDLIASPAIIKITGKSTSYTKNVAISLYVNDDVPVEYVGTWLYNGQETFLGQDEHDTGIIDCIDLANGDDIHVVGEQMMYVTTPTICYNEDAVDQFPLDDDDDDDD